MLYLKKSAYFAIILKKLVSHYKSNHICPLIYNFLTFYWLQLRFTTNCPSIKFEVWNKPFGEFSENSFHESWTLVQIILYLQQSIHQGKVWSLVNLRVPCQHYVCAKKAYQEPAFEETIYEKNSNNVRKTEIHKINTNYYTIFLLWQHQYIWCYSDTKLIIFHDQANHIHVQNSKMFMANMKKKKFKILHNPCPAFVIDIFQGTTFHNSHIYF